MDKNRRGKKIVPVGGYKKAKLGGEKQPVPVKPHGRSTPEQNLVSFS